MNRVVGVRKKTLTTPEGAPVHATVLCSEAVDWTVADYKSKNVDYFDARRFIAVFTDGRNVIMYDRRGVERDTDITRCNRR